MPPSNPNLPPAAAQPSLTPEQLDQLAQAKQRGVKIHRAIAIAKADGATIAIFGAITLGLSIGDWVAMLLGAAMAALGVLQWLAAARLAQLDPAAARRLAIHQLILGCLITLYALARLWAGPNDPQLASLTAADPQIADLIRTIHTGFYALVALIGVVGCGLTALYYRSREKLIAQYIAETPQWILQIQRV